MGFFDGLSRSWQLLKLSLSIVRQEKKLMVFPVMTGIAAIAILATFILPFYFFREGTPLAVWTIGFFAMYVLLYFVGIYFMAALVGCATIKLEGGKPELSDGFRIANQNLGRIIQWAIVAAIVGLIIQALERAARDNIVARIIISMIGFAWTMATFFVVPVIIYERLNVFPAIKRSGSIFSKTWGETFVGNFAVSMIFMLLTLLGVLFIIIGVIYLTGIMLWAMVIFGLVWIVLMQVLSVATQGVLLAALYRYAVTGKIAADYQSHANLFK